MAAASLQPSTITSSPAKAAVPVATDSQQTMTQVSGAATTTIKRPMMVRNPYAKKTPQLLSCNVEETGTSTSLPNSNAPPTYQNEAHALAAESKLTRGADGAPFRLLSSSSSSSHASVVNQQPQPPQPNALIPHPKLPPESLVVRQLSTAGPVNSNVTNAFSTLHPPSSAAIAATMERSSHPQGQPASASFAVAADITNQMHPFTHNNSSISGDPQANNPFTFAAKQAPPPPSRPSLGTRPVYTPGPVPFDESCIDHWIFPCHDAFPTRQYQLEITQTAMFHNTLVSLPTGLGKTLIAAVVLYNYYRWFPTGKIIFMAPTLPLVEQQVKACYDIMGIPANVTAVLTGKLSPTRRQEIWARRSVFFCTPQTVQKDLDAQRLDARLVVCIVLDEAHKSTGDYAYCKVVQALERAEAKFRILGLSATPGSNIKAIQQVVDALRINKIEARNENHPSVAPYTHKRENEIIIVRQVSAARDVERALNDLIGPLLDKLRSYGGLPKVSGNATVTAFNILRAKQEYEKRADRDNSALGYFFAAQTFVQLRDSIQRQGIGMVQTRVKQLRYEPQRGVLSTIVRGNEFTRLYEKVKEATCMPDSTQAMDKLANNPKLMKLVEILIEHFKRAEATSNPSTRAIVFSQYRESVSEIVSVLTQHGKDNGKSLIRPRRFIGQGKGAKGEIGEAEKLKGMKQAEQQKVIQEFRSNVHNVLVCTCIGEEGLDIGEVDLIVNFDTLRNPIRMLQRIGRTGRKREGRVVCLVAEGAEERTLKASKQAENTLAHSLRNQTSFQFMPTVPLFPKEPEIKLNKIELAHFRMSQVEGHGSTVSRVTGATTASRPKVAAAWRLSLDENAERLRVLGRHGTVLSVKSLNAICLIRKRLLSGRTVGSRSKKFAVGRTVEALRRIESLSLNSPATRIGRIRGEDPLIAQLFPLERSKSAESVAASLKLRGQNKPLLLGDARHQLPLTTREACRIQPIAPLMRPDEGLSSVVRATNAQQTNLSLPNPLSRDAHPSWKHANVEPDDLHHSNQLEPNPKQNKNQGSGALDHQQHAPLENLYAKHRVPSIGNLKCELDQTVKYVKTAEFDARNEVMTVVHRSSQVASATAREHDSIGNSLIFNAASGETAAGVCSSSSGLQFPTHREQNNVLQPGIDDTHITTPSACTAISGKIGDFRVPELLEQHIYESRGAIQDDTRNKACRINPSRTQVLPSDDVFRLPTPPDSSSSEDESCKELEACKIATTTDDLRLPTPPDSSSGEDECSDEETPNDHLIQRTPTDCRAQQLTGDGEGKLLATKCAPLKGDDEDFRLPTQESSSDDESAVKNQNRNGEETAIDYAGGLPNLQSLSASQRSSQVSSQKGTARVRFSPTSTQHSAAIAQSVDASGAASVELPLRKRTNRKVLAIEDTPESTGAGKEMKGGKGLTANNPYRSLEASLKIIRRFSSCETLADSDHEQCYETDIEDNLDDIVCAVCQIGDDTDDDPIILCDGTNANGKCNFAVHVSCYKLSKSVLADDEWRCDPCKFRSSGRFGPIACSRCQATNGVLKMVDDKTWAHLDCYAPRRCNGRLTKFGAKNGRGSKQDRRPLSSLAANNLASALSARKRSRMHYRRYFDEEAGIASEDDMEGDQEEEDMIAALEEEEAMDNSFINDSSQLGYTQDALDLADCEDTAHRELDNIRERMHEFSTPVLNRRLKRKKVEGKWTETPESAPSSEKGLGNMHFIRSVLEHHRKGGRSDEIEEFYHEVEEEQSPIDEENLVPEPPAPVRTVIYYQDSESDENDVEVV